MSSVPELDSLGEIYPGFDRDRRILRQRKAGAATIWREAFAAVQLTPEFFQRSSQDIARETMRMLMDVLGY